MGKLNKYIFAQVAGATLMTMSLFIFVIVVTNIIKQVMSDPTTGQLGYLTLFRILGLLIPGAMPYALPMGVLTAILIVFGRMSAQSEIVAIKAIGRSIYSMAAPVLFFALLMSILSLFINFYYAPNADYAVESIIKNFLRNNPTKAIRPGEFVNNLSNFVIYTDAIEDGKYKGLKIWSLDGNKDASKKDDTFFIQADSGTIQLENNNLVLTLENGSIEPKPRDAKDFDKINPPSTGKEFKIKISMDKLFGEKTVQEKRLKRMNFNELLEKRQQYNEKESDLKKRIEVQFFMQKNFALAFSIFAMVLLAVPLGIKASRSETFVNLVIALALAMSYYMFVLLIERLFNNTPSVRPDILIWIPNLVFETIGMILIYKSSKN